MNSVMIQMAQLQSGAEGEAEVQLVAEEAGSSFDLLTFQNVFPLTVLVLLGLAIPLGMMAVSWWLNRHQSNNPAKDEPYECGLQAVVGSADERFSVKFYLIAMLFLVFDLEVAFLYPWAVHFNEGGWGMVGVLVVFLIMLEAGYLYLYRKGALDWDD